MNWRKGIERMIAAVALGAVGLFVGLPGDPVLAYAPSQAGPVKLRIEVTDLGFNDNPGDFTVEVQQGSLVEMTFVWAHVGYVEEEHIMVLEMAGQQLEWDQIDFRQREATLQFIVDKPGTFDFKCDLDCEIHDYLQKGHLKVKAGGTGGATYTPTTLTIEPSSWVTTGDPLDLTVALQDSKGAPVSKAVVRFYLDTEFAGNQGQMELGRAKTNAQGVALLGYRPTASTPQLRIRASFEGLGVYAGSEEAIEVQQVGYPPSAYQMAPIGLEPFRRWAPVALALVIGSVWAICGFVLYLALGVAWSRRKGVGA